MAENSTAPFLTADRRGIESSTRLGRHRWTIKRPLVWLGGCRRLTVRYEHHGDRFAAFVTLASILTFSLNLVK